MKTLALAYAYVALDRLAFSQLQRISALPKYCAFVRDRLKGGEGLAGLRTLIGAEAEEQELLWLCGVCQGMPGIATSHGLFGWPASELKKALRLINGAERVTEKIQVHPFGILLQLADPLAAQVPEHLRAYSELARAAQRDFGHGSEWFLNIAKARLVQHVTHRTREPHDREVSALVAAMTGTDYNPGAQKRWRDKHRGLIEDTLLDPYTIETLEWREQRHQQLQKQLTAMPGLGRTVERLTAAYLTLPPFRPRKPSNRRSPQNRR